MSQLSGAAAPDAEAECRRMVQKIKKRGGIDPRTGLLMNGLAHSTYATPFLSEGFPLKHVGLDDARALDAMMFIEVHIQGEFSTRLLEPGQLIELLHAQSSDRAGALPVPHADFFQAAPVSSTEIVLNDARIKLVRESIGAESLRARVVVGGQISARKGITFTASNYRQEEPGDKDRAILDQTRHFPFVRYAISYVRDAVEMRKYRAYCGDAAYLIAKLERRPAVDEALRVADFADEVWLCRGDLRAELGLRANKTLAQGV